MNSTQQNYKQKMMQKYQQEAYKAYESASGKKLERNENGTLKKGRNDDLDGFRHAYVSAAVAQDYTAFIAKIAGDEVEDKGDARGQSPEERNMDDWNNAVGREIGSSTDTREEIKEAVWEALKNGDLIIDPDKDQRKYQSNFEKLKSRINELWNQTKNWTPPRRDPLALDLDGNGIETRGADGLKTGTGWVRSDDGLLVLDRNSNGTIDNGGELFGVDTVKSDGKKATDGFDALSDLDSNDDGVFDSKDTRFKDVRVWRDLNQDGVSQSKELSTLSANNIRSISLSKTSKTTNLGHGNTQTATATFTRTDDTTGTAANLGLASNTFYRRFTNRVTLTDKAKKLPEVNGSGSVRNLREAMSSSSALTTLVTTYAKQTSYAKQRAQLDGLVKAWADTSAHNSSIAAARAKGFNLIYMIPGQTAAHFARPAKTLTENTNNNNNSTTTTTLTAEETRRRQALMAEQGKVKKMIATLEAFNGNRFVTVNSNSVTTGAGARIMTDRPATGNGGDMAAGRRTPRAFVSLSAQQITLLKQSYEQLKESVYVSLLKQTRLKAYSDKVSVTVNKKGHLALDFTALNTLLTTRRSKKSVETLGDLIELARYMGPALAAEGWDGFATLKTWVSEADGKTAQEKVLTDLHVKSGNANANGTDKAEIFYDGGKGNTINAGGGHDIVFGGGGNDALSGGSGNDRLNGEEMAMPPLWALRRQPICLLVPGSPQ